MVAGALGCARAGSLAAGAFPPRVLPQSHRTSCALLAMSCFSENEALIVDVLDWKKF
jgi:hypothetical protein